MRINIIKLTVFSATSHIMSVGRFKKQKSAIVSNDSSLEYLELSNMIRPIEQPDQNPINENLQLL